MFFILNHKIRHHLFKIPNCFGFLGYNGSISLPIIAVIGVIVHNLILYLFNFYT